MRRILFVLLVSLFSSVVFAAIGDTINIGLIPYNAGENVDLKSKDFPVRTGATLVYDGELTDLTNPDKYFRPHMVAAGGIYGIPSNGTWVGDGYIHYDSIAPLVVVAQCPSDFRYVSQTHSEFQREFRLYVVKRSAYSNNVSGVTEYHRGSSFDELSDNNIRSEVPFEGIDADSYMNMWFDMVLGLPYDNNGIASSGVTIDGIFYPLIEAQDYTASVAITISWTQPYTITNGYGQVIKSDTFRIQRTLTIPFSGYVGVSPGDSTINMNILSLPGAANINLNDGYTGAANITDVADIEMLVSFTETEGKINPVTDENVRIFLSSSLNPTNAAAQPFMLVHEDAKGVINDNNHFLYRLIVNSTEGKAQSRIFDGTDYLNGNEIEHYLESDCHNDDRLFQIDGKYFHFHTFRGTVSVEVLNRTNLNELMMAGRYTSRVYVHVVVED